MNRREDPQLQQHRSRLLQLAEITNVKPGRGNSKKRGQRASHGSSNGNARIRSQKSLQDIVREDPGYTNIEHLVFPERKSSNPNLAESSSPSKSKGNNASGRTKLAEVFGTRNSRGPSQDANSVRKNHSTSLDSGGVLSHHGTGSGSITRGSNQRRWLSQNSQTSKQYSMDEGVRGLVGVAGPVSSATSNRTPVAAPRRVSPASDSTEIVNTAPRNERGSNFSILHLRSTSDPWEVSSQCSNYSASSLKSVSSNRGKTNSNARSASCTRGSSIPTLKRDVSTSSSGSLKYNRQENHRRGRRREPANSFIGGGSMSGELFAGGTCSRELSPVRWCDHEVDGVYLGRSGWVQVQQRSLDDRRSNYESNHVGGMLPRRVNVKLADYHCSKSEPGKCPIDNQRPDYLALHNQDYESSSVQTSPHSIPESFSPPSLTPIISPPPAFQDVAKRSSNRHARNVPFLPRSNAIIDSDIISPPPSPPQVKWSSLPLSASRKSVNVAPSRWKKSTTTPSSSATTPQQQQQQRQYQIAQAKSLEDQSTSRRNQFAQRYVESSSSSSSSLGFRSLDSCVIKSTMPRLAENTDSSVEGYDDGDEDDHVRPATVCSSPESVRINGDRTSRIHRTQSALRKSPGSESAKLLFSPHSSFTSSSSSSSTSSSLERQGRSTPNLSRRNNVYRHQNSRNVSSSPDSLQSRVRRSRSLQLPEKKSLGTQGLSKDHSRESNDFHKVLVKVVNDKGKRYALSNRKAQSTDEALNEDIRREAEVVSEFLYRSRNRPAGRNQHRYDGREENANARRNVPDIYFISSKQPQATKPSTAQQNRRPRTLQRGATTPNSAVNANDFGANSDAKLRCNSSTCDFWPHCSQRDIYSPSQTSVFMKVSQSYPAHQRMSDTNSSKMNCSSACSSPASLERMDEPRKGRLKNGKYSKGLFKSHRSQMTNGGLAGYDGAVKVSPNQNVNVTSRSSSGMLDSESTSPSSSSSDIWVTTSDRTVTKSPRNAKSSGASTPNEDGAGALKKDISLSRPGSAPGKREQNLTEDTALDPHQRSLSLPKSFLAHEAGDSDSKVVASSWRGKSSQRSSPSPSRSCQQDLPAPHTAPVSPLHDKQMTGQGKDRRRMTGGKSQKRIKASSTPALLDCDQEPRRWSDDEGEDETVRVALEHPLTEASIPLASHPHMSKAPAMSSTSVTNNVAGNLSLRGGPSNQQESVLQKFRKSFSLRFHKKGSKESQEGDGPAEDNDVAHLDDEDFPPAPAPEQPPHKEDPVNDQKFRFGPLVWRSSKERKKGNKAARNAKCNSGDSGIQIEADLQMRASRNNVRRTNSDLGGQRLLQWDARSGYTFNYRRMLSTPSPIKTRPPRLSPRHSSHDIVTLRSNAKGRPCRTNLRRSLSQPLGINQLSPLMRTKNGGARIPGGHVLSEDEHDGRGGTSDDEMMSDSESSISSLSDRKKCFEQGADDEVAILAEAVWDHVAMEPEELAFRAGDVIDVLDTLDRDWWWGCCRGEHGWFPAAFVRLRVSQEDTVEDCLAAIASGTTSNATSRRRTSISLLSNEQVRTSVVRELVQTERDFVKVLRDVTEGYISECRNRPDMFTEEQIETIFINLEELLEFQTNFLKDLESRIDWNAPHKSCVGEIFLKHRSGFKMYSEYCNSHPMAMATLQEMYQYNRYNKFFEACRLMRGLIEIPLDGYLLTPVQRICKYPLQLAELLKYTKTDHADYQKIQEALEAMRDVAVLINERKRRMESLEKLAAWQLRVEGWEGEDLIEVSSQLIYQGEAMRVTTGMWTSNIMLFLFDHQLVYCKKDLLKRNTYVYKGRIYLDTSEVIDVPDGKDHQLGVTVRHCLKIYSCVRDKWLLFCCRTAEEKRKWLLAMEEERKLVAQDQNDGLEFPAAARQLAKLAATRRCRPPVKPRSKAYKRESAYEIPTLPSQGSTNSLGRKVGTWFMFGSSKKGARPQPS